jgi:hypothetical protein
VLQIDARVDATGRALDYKKKEVYPVIKQLCFAMMESSNVYAKAWPRM